MTYCNTNFDDTLWEGFGQLIPDDQNRSDALEQVVAEFVYRHRDAECLSDEHIDAADYLLDGSTPGVDVQKPASQRGEL